MHMLKFLLILTTSLMSYIYILSLYYFSYKLSKSILSGSMGIMLTAYILKGLVSDVRMHPLSSYFNH